MLEQTVEWTWCVNLLWMSTINTTACIVFPVKSLLF